MAVEIKSTEEVSKKYFKKCEYCGCEFTYQYNDLGFRIWYPHGFIYCPHCQRPLRHRGDVDAIK